MFLRSVKETDRSISKGMLKNCLNSFLFKFTPVFFLIDVSKTNKRNKLISKEMSNMDLNSSHW